MNNPTRNSTQHIQQRKEIYFYHEKPIVHKTITFYPTSYIFLKKKITK